MRDFSWAFFHDQIREREKAKNEIFEIILLKLHIKTHGKVMDVMKNRHRRIF